MIRQLRSIGLTSDALYMAAFASIIGSIAVWFLQGRDKEDRASAERLGIFVGLWAPTLWAIGTTLKDQPSSEA